MGVSFKILINFKFKGQPTTKINKNRTERFKFDKWSTSNTFSFNSQNLWNQERIERIVRSCQSWLTSFQVGRQEVPNWFTGEYNNLCFPEKSFNPLPPQVSTVVVLFAKLGKIIRFLGKKYKDDEKACLFMSYFFPPDDLQKSFFLGGGKDT